MKRSTNRILTSHAGSIIRPPELVEMLKAKQSNQTFDERTHDALLRRSVADVVRKQAETGLDIIDDGEYGKSSWTAYVTDRFGGFEQRQRQPGEAPTIALGKDRTDFAEFYNSGAPQVGGAGNPAYWVATSKVHYKPQQLQRDIANFKAALQHVKVEEAFLPVVAPASIEPTHRNGGAYPTDEAYVYGLADALHDEYKAIVDAGFIVQVDDAWIPALWDRMLLNMDLKKFHEFARMRIDALNHALKGIPEDRVRYHICWGSWHGPHVSDIPLRDVAPIILRVNAQAFSIESANPRHEHEWMVWKDMKWPDGKIIIPGVITHSTNVVEHPELVAWRFKNFAGVVGRENVIGGSDCGFAQGFQGARVHPSIMWAKYQAQVEGAKLASKELWRR